MTGAAQPRLRAAARATALPAGAPDRAAPACPVPCARSRSSIPSRRFPQAAPVRSHLPFDAIEACQKTPCLERNVSRSNDPSSPKFLTGRTLASPRTSSPYTGSPAPTGVFTRTPPSPLARITTIARSSVTAALSTTQPSINCFPALAPCGGSSRGLNAMFAVPASTIANDPQTATTQRFLIINPPRASSIRKPANPAAVGPVTQSAREKATPAAKRQAGTRSGSRMTGCSLNKWPDRAKTLKQLGRATPHPTPRLPAFSCA